MQTTDIETICHFPQTAEELFYFYPKGDYPLTVAQLISAIEQRSYPTVIEKDGEIAGFANFYHWQLGGCCKVGNVIVNPAMRGQGIAKYLMKTILAKAREYYRAHQVQVSCFSENTTALLLYQQLGFKPFTIEQRINKQGAKVALIHFAYELI